jgi:sialate O-acetylesterase
MNRILLVHALILVAAMGYSREPAFRMAPPFGDNMVLQQKHEVPFFGKGTPGSTISIQPSWGKNVTTEVKADGSWMLSLRTPAAGGPHQIEVRHDDTVLTLRNIVLGEVWLCSGQSNMEMPLEGWPPDTILHSAAEIQHATYPDIRLFNVKRAFSATPESDCAGRWEECSPTTSPTFSATAYFFGRKLYQSLKVPIGLILSSWGGTPVEAWTSAEFLRRVPELDTTLQKIRVAAEGMKGQLAWLQQFPVIDVSTRARATKWQNLALRDDDCAALQLDDSRWRIMRLPTIWEKSGLGEFDGVVWFRKEITVPAAWVHKDLIVELGPVDDMDVTFVNGRKVGGHETEGFWKAERVYRVPKSLVDTTIIRIAVRVTDNGGGGGLYGEGKSMSIHPEGQDERLSLAGDWRYLPVAEYRADRLFVFGSKGERFFERPSLPIDFSAYTPTSLFNGMIAPLVPFSLAGVIWYQGESNAGAPLMYKKLFPLMIENWRSAFRDSALPFYFVQIAPYAYGEPTESQFLREAQSATLAVKNTGMAVTLDIGNPSNIHPANKQEVGRRLALWALAKNYGKKLEYSGPLYRSIRKFQDRIELSFDHAPNGLVLIGREEGNGFLIAGENRQFVPADVRVEGQKVVVSSVEIANPQAVRYAFRNTAESTLFNMAGLPASSFRTDDWSR